MAVAASSSTSAVPPTVTRTLSTHDYRCAGCGYGISVRELPDECPMCHGALWEPAEWRPFTSTQTGR
jgi:rubrerythrin